MTVPLSPVEGSTITRLSSHCTRKILVFTLKAPPPRYSQSKQEIRRAIVIALSANNAAHLHQHMFEPQRPGRTVSSLLKLARLVATVAGSSSATATDLTLDGVAFSDVVIGQRTDAVETTFKLLAGDAQALVLPRYPNAI